MNAPTKTITTPFGNHAVVIKEWITGADREYIKAPLLQAVDVKPRMQGQSMNVEMGKLDMATILKESDHREIEKFVISVDGSTEDLVMSIFSMHEDDTAFIIETIKALGKKKVESAQM